GELNEELTLRDIVSVQRQLFDCANDQDATPLQQYENNGRAPNPNFPVPGLAEFGLPLLGYLNANPAVPRPKGDRQITEELQLQGNMLDKHLQFTAGAFYFKDKSVGGFSSSYAVLFCRAALTGLC